MNLFALATFAAVGINCHASFIEVELTVTSEWNTGVGGFMFDVEANQDMDVTIDTLLFNFNGYYNRPEYGLWFKEGSFVGYNTDESAWTPACSGVGIEQERLSDFNSATTKSDCSFTIPAGQTYGVYIHGLSRSMIVEKEGSSFDDIVASDGHIKVYTGLGVSSTKGPFGNGYRDDYYVTPTVKLMYTAVPNNEPDELTVTSEFNTGVGGLMFDVEANQDMDVTIDTILFNFNGYYNRPEYGLWFKEGSFVGYNTDESAWTPACSGNGIEQARLSDFNSATAKSDCSFTIPAGQTYGVYIHGLSRGLVVEKEGSSFDDIVASDDNIKVYTGLGVSSTYGPFGKGYGDDYYVTPTVKLMYTALFNEEEDDCSIDVLSVDHKFGPSVVGKYFNFDKDALDTILGRSDWSNERLGTDKGTVVVWRVPNGGSVGDAHGRLDKSAKKGDWSVGDEITFLDCSMR